MNRNVVKLEAPGAGISAAESFVLNLVIKPFRVRNENVAGALRELKRSAYQIEEVVSRIDGEHLTVPVLVTRPWFVEDSSRNWSVAMLCRHLAIVDSAPFWLVYAGLQFHN